MNRISLVERLENLRTGRSSDPAYSIRVIKAMAEMPITQYLHGWEYEERVLQSLRMCLNVEMEELKSMSYQDVATRIAVLYRDQDPEISSEVEYMIGLLAGPLHREAKKKMAQESILKSKNQITGKKGGEENE